MNRVEHDSKIANGIEYNKYFIFFNLKVILLI